MVSRTLSNVLKRFQKVSVFKWFFPPKYTTVYSSHCNLTNEALKRVNNRKKHADSSLLKRFRKEVMDVKDKIFSPRKPPTCRKVYLESEQHNIGKTPRYHDALPRDCKYAYMTPGYYATGFRILDVYKTEVDFSEYRNLTFIVDPDKVKKWGYLRRRIPYPEGRITDLPGTRDLHYKNYCLRSLTPESAMSWRNSLLKFSEQNPDNEEENEFSTECVCPE